MQILHADDIGKAHDNCLIRIFSLGEFFLLYRPKYLIKNNGLMSTGVKIPIHEAIVFYLSAPILTVFWGSTRPVYVSLGSSLPKLPDSIGVCRQETECPAFPSQQQFFRGYYPQDTAQLCNTLPSPYRDSPPARHQDIQQLLGHSSLFRGIPREAKPFFDKNVRKTAPLHPRTTWPAWRGPWAAGGPAGRREG